MTEHELALTLRAGRFIRATGDNAVLRITAMSNTTGRHGVGIDKRGIAPTLRRGIGTRHEFSGHALAFPAGSVWSRRFGILYQPRPAQSCHLCCGTSFNASGDACQYDAMGFNTPPERSRKRELGARLDGAGGRYTTRISDALQQRRIVAPRLVSADLMTDTRWARTSP